MILTRIISDDGYGFLACLFRQSFSFVLINKVCFLPRVVSAWRK